MVLNFATVLESYAVLYGHAQDAVRAAEGASEVMAF